MHWCLGVYSSGSTWLFNTVRKCAAEVCPDKRVVSQFVYHLISLPEKSSIDRVTVVKSHHTEAEAERALRQRASAIWISVRDPRDCVASMIRYGSYTFPDAVDAVEASALSCAHVAADARATTFRYEDGFIEDLSTLDRIAEGFSSTLSAAARQRIHEEMQRSAIERFISAFETLPTAVYDAESGTAYDEETHWHTHHANRSGEIGRWRHELASDQVAEIEARLGAWMRRFGYDPATAGGGLRTDPGFALSHASKASLLGALEAFDKTAPLIVAVASNPYALLLDNWICHMQALGLTRFLIVAMDDILYDKLVRAKLSAARCDFDGTAGDFWLRRAQVWELLVREGYDTIQSDIDAVWLRDPIRFFAENSQTDFLCSQGTLHPIEILTVWGFILCTGLLRLNAGQPAERLLDAMLSDPALIRETDDQYVLNTMLAEQGVAWARDDIETRLESLHGTSFSCYKKVLPGDCHALGLRIGMLPHHDFPRLPTPLPGSYVKHVLRPGDDIGRIDGLRACGCWMMDQTTGVLGPY